MKTVKYEIRLKGLATPDGTISVKALLDLMGSLTDCAERGLRLAVEGSSVKTGRTPAWLERAVDFTISGIKKPIDRSATRLQGNIARYPFNPVKD